MTTDILQQSTDMLTSGITMLKLTLKDRLTLLPNASSSFHPKPQSSQNWESQGHTEQGVAK